MKGIIREIREDLNRLVHQLMEVESFLRDVQAGKIQPPPGYPQRSHTGTWKGRVLDEMKATGECPVCASVEPE